MGNMKPLTPVPSGLWQVWTTSSQIAQEAAQVAANRRVCRAARGAGVLSSNPWGNHQPMDRDRRRSRPGPALKTA